MIVGLGVDLAKISRFEKLLDKYGERAAEKILAPVEIVRWQQAARPAAYIAKRWAVKEALGKALGTGIAHGITLPQIAVVSGAGGAPQLALTGAAAVAVAARGVDYTHLSISDEAEYAVAVVVLEKSAVD